MPATHGYEPAEAKSPVWSQVMMLLIWLAAAAVFFLPFASATSPWDAVILRVPGNQGNWWHALAGAPFFLAYPMLWVRIRTQFAQRQLPAALRRLVSGAAVLSIGGTAAVETPFLLHLAGTSEWQRLLVLGLGFGVMVCSTVVLLVWRRGISADARCIAWLNAAYLANAALCLLVYSEATGSAWSRAGWFLLIVIVWPMAVELMFLLARSVRDHAPMV